MYCFNSGKLLRLAFQPRSFSVFINVSCALEHMRCLQFFGYTILYCSLNLLYPNCSKIGGVRNVKSLPLRRRNKKLAKSVIIKFFRTLETESLQ